MTPIFADTGYWIALLDPADDLHDRAVGRSRETGDRPVVASDLVRLDAAAIVLE
jgi:predicted nucleic acid-binding protein